MGLFGKNKSIRETFEEIKNLEASLWNMINNDFKIAIPEMIKRMNKMVAKELGNLRKIEEDKKVKDFFLQKSNYAQELENLFKELEQLLMFQLDLLKNIKDMNVQDIHIILDGPHKEGGGFSKSSQLIHKIMETIDNKIEVIVSDQHRFKNDVVIENGKKFTIVIDTKTNLEWTSFTHNTLSRKTMTWKEARDLANRMGNGWRLPTMDEFSTLKLSTEEALQSGNNCFGNIGVIHGYGNCWLVDNSSYKDNYVHFVNFGQSKVMYPYVNENRIHWDSEIQMDVMFVRNKVNN